MAIEAGTNTEETRSASRWMGGFEACTSSTISTIRDRAVSAPTPSTLNTTRPVWLIVPQ